jgi:hypothetical protein
MLVFIISIMTTGIELDQTGNMCYCAQIVVWFCWRVCIDILDLLCSAVAAFGSGAVFSAVSGMGGPNVLGNALTTGFFFALVQGGLYQV